MFIGQNTLAISLGVVFGVLFLAVGIAAAVFINRRRRKKDRRKHSVPAKNDGESTRFIPNLVASISS